jgi:hypothetical protein
MTMPDRLVLITVLALLAACADEDPLLLEYTAADSGAGVTDTGVTDTSGADASGADASTDIALPDTSPLPDATGDTGDTGGTADTGAATGWDAFYQTYLEPAGCASGYCHGGGSGYLSFSDASSAYDALVDQPVTESVCGTTTRVVPGDATASALYLRLRPSAMDDPSCEPTKMPPDSEGLSEEAVAGLAAWINEGALR